MRTKSSRVNSFSATLMGSRPTNSGIRPNFTKSSGMVWFKSSAFWSSESISTDAPKPTVCWWMRASTVLSRPTKAPPQINKILVVSISISSWLGCLRPPCGGTPARVPSMIFKSACCTPSPETSRVMDTFSERREILSISSIKMMPRSAAATLPFAAFISFKSTFSTSSPT